MFILQLFQKLNGHPVVVEPFQRCTNTDIVTFDSEVGSEFGIDFGKQYMGRHLAAALFLRRRCNRLVALGQLFF